MAPQRALKDEKDIAAVPLDKPVLIELPEGIDFASDDLGNPENVDKIKKADLKPEPPNDGSKNLEAQLEAALAAQQAEKDRAERAERDRAEAQRIAAVRAREADEARKRALALEGDVISGGLQAAQNELAAAKAELVRAGEGGDYAAMAEAQARIGRASAQVVNLEGGAAEIAGRKPSERRDPEPQQRQPTFEEHVRDNPSLMTSEKDWMLRNEAHFRDADFNRKLDFAYHGAMNKGLVRGSADYFDHIERATGLKTELASTHDERDVTVPQAPVSRNERGGDSRSRSTITLSPEQREMAHNLGVTEVEYAKQVVRFEQARRDDPERYTSRS
jgi:hypothetical protein